MGISLSQIRGKRLHRQFHSLADSSEARESRFSNEIVDHLQLCHFHHLTATAWISHGNHDPISFDGGSVAIEMFVHDRTALFSDNSRYTKTQFYFLSTHVKNLPFCLHCNRALNFLISPFSFTSSFIDRR